MELKLKVSKRERLKSNMRHLVYVIKSYFNLEPCGYCGDVNDEHTICHKCVSKDWSLD